MLRVYSDLQTNPSLSLIGWLRHTRGLLPSIATLVTLTLLAWQLTPTVVAAQQMLDDNAATLRVTETDSDEAKFAKTLEQLERKLDHALAKLEQNQDATLELADIKQLDNTARQLDQLITQRFGQLRSWIEQKALGAEILQRHDEAVASYQQELNTLLANLSAIEQSPDSQTRKARVRQARDHLQANQKKRPHQPFDPGNLPFRTPSSEIRAPIEDPIQLQALLTDPATHAIEPKALTTKAAPQPEDLAPTEDVQITPEIQALAQSLNNSPVEIYNWVHNAIEFIPTYGSIQGSQLTLETRRGNAFDTASLLIALLRAAEIPARYVYGTVQIPVEQVMNWVGGVETPQAAMELLGQGGIPNTGLAQGGVIKFIKLEHIWVEAWVDFAPSRGAVNLQGDSWVALDGSFKLYEITGDSQFLQDAFDGQQLLDTLLSFANIDEVNHRFSSVMGLTDIIGQIQQQEQLFSDYYELKYEQGDPLQNKFIIPSERPILSSGLPYSIVRKGTVFSSLPAQFQHKFRYQLFTDDMSYFSQSPLLSFEADLVHLARKNINLRFVPSTPNDEATLLSFLPKPAPGTSLSPSDLPTSVPGYLINLTAQLVVDGKVVQQQAGFTLGESIIASPAITKLTGGWFEAKNEITAGEYHAITITLQGFSNAQLNKAPNPSAESLLHQAGVALLEGSDIFLGFINDMNLGHAVRHPSFGSVSTGLQTKFSFLVPRQVDFVESRVDLDYMALSLVANASSGATRQQINEAVGLSLSMLEDQIPTYYLSSRAYPGEGISATKAIGQALLTGQSVYAVNSSNINTVLPLLSHDSAVLTDIRNGVNAGLEVTVHERPVQLSAWTGAGYMLIDPATGSGAYRISGGYNGGGAVTELNPALAVLGLSIALPIVIPTMLADEGDCGAKEKIQSPDWSWLIYLAMFLLLIFLMTGSGGALAPAVARGFAALLSLFTSLQAQAQGGCKVYISAYQSNKGTRMNEASEHISDAQKNVNIPKMLSWGEPRRKARFGKWYLREAEAPNTPCYKGGSPLACDEYPPIATLQGGPEFWPDAVSLRMINGQHNSTGGATLNAFSLPSKCHLLTNETFEVRVELDPGTVTRGLDEDGNQCY